MAGSAEPDGMGPGAHPSTGETLLAYLEFSRDLLARRLVGEQPQITDPDLNAVVVSSLLQTLFLKTCQECGLAEPGTLAVLGSSEGIGKRLGRACADAGLDPVSLFGTWYEGARSLAEIPDEPLRKVIVRTDTAAIPTPVRDLPPEDLAAILDRFLATRLKVGEGYRVLRSGKSALLYTGTVDIPSQDEVVQAVSTGLCNAGRDLQARGTQPVRILDPSCGAGLFLLAAYRVLARNSRQGRGTPSVPELQKILSALYGIDIDPESACAARFVLLLAFIDDSWHSGVGTAAPDQIASVARILPETIRCGNSLIGPDYFSGMPVFPFNAEERRRVNAFDWHHAFPEVFAAGGFDAVIGAPPPYRPFAVKAREEYFQTHYESYAVSAGLYSYFIERGLGLLRAGGALSVLVPGTFLRSQHARPLRRLLLTRQVRQIACTGRTRPLPDGEAVMYHLALTNTSPEGPFEVLPAATVPGRHAFTIDQRSLDDGGWRLEDTRAAHILEKICARGTLLEDYLMGEIVTGTYRGRNNPLVVDRETRNRLTKRAPWTRRFFVPLLCPEDIRRYVPQRPSRFVIAETCIPKIRRCRALVQYLEQVKKTGDITSSGNDHDCGQDPVLFRQLQPKILFLPHQQSPAFSLDQKGRYAISYPLLAILRNDPYLAAILNSSLGRFIIIQICPYTDGGYDLGPAALGKFPVMVPDFDRLADKKRHEKITGLVSQLITLHEYLQKAGTGQEPRLVQQEIDVMNVRIDALVYEVYGLTKGEMGVVEATLLV